MTKSLAELQEILISGQKLSMQGSLGRRSPDKKAIPFLLEARKGLKVYVEKYPTDAVAWKVLSQAEECLLNYREALICLKKALSFCPPDKKDFKRLALLKEYELKWDELVLTPEQINLLNSFLNEKLKGSPCDHTLRLTKEWLEENSSKEKAKIVNALQNHGGFCDCEVLANITG